MNQFLLFFVVISLGMGIWLSRAGWAKMLALVPIGALVPAFFATGSACGLDFMMNFFTEGHCSISNDAPFRLFSAYFVFGIVGVLVASLLVKIARLAWGSLKAGE